MDLGRTLDRVDGYILLVGEYNHGCPAVLKNAMDHTFVEWRRKPVAFVGGARAIEQLRQVAVEFETAPLRHAVHILPDVMVPAMQATDAADVTAAFAPLGPNLKTLAEDLAWWTEALAPPAAGTEPQHLGAVARAHTAVALAVRGDHRPDSRVVTAPNGRSRRRAPHWPEHRGSAVGLTASHPHSRPMTWCRLFGGGGGAPYFRWW
ncbi:NADPH-dependent FMN reductase [Actinomadura sp. NTSP31]|uniref:NADPH-dependent FMN reductase n=1 Tax=Actinomadura sp. NTSP31 TaxID=1735447 RepID=UPI0035C0C710